VQEYLKGLQKLPEGKKREIWIKLQFDGSLDSVPPKPQYKHFIITGLTICGPPPDKEGDPSISHRGWSVSYFLPCSGIFAKETDDAYFAALAPLIKTIQKLLKNEHPIQKRPELQGVTFRYPLAADKKAAYMTTGVVGSHCLFCTQKPDEMGNFSVEFDEEKHLRKYEDMVENFRLVDKYIKYVETLWEAPG